MSTKDKNLLTWLLVSRIAGLVIVVSLLLLFMVQSLRDRDVDKAVVLGFLGVATGLLGLPAGYYIARKSNSQSESDRS